MSVLRLIAMLLASTLLLSCEESGDCSVEYQNQFVLDQMRDAYLWYDEIPDAVDPFEFSSPQQLLDFISFDEKDRFSYITDAARFDSLFNAGQYMGYGFSYLVNADDTVSVRFVYTDSPSAEAGLQRGDEVLSINGETVAEIIQANAWAGIFGPAEEGHPLELIIRKADTSVLILNLTKRIVNINTVLHQSVISSANDQIGYMAFKSFLSTSNAELAAVFANFKAQSVNKVILDLRYNGGGSVSVARNLGSYLYQGFQSGEVFTHLIHNDKKQINNSTYHFIDLTHALDVDEVIVITTGETCSASEMVVNGLKPFVDVKLVGSTSCGKPVGMNKFEFCGKALLPVTFAGYNDLGEGDYFDGLTTQCAASDDVAFDLGEQAEPMLAAALYLSQQGQCLSSRPAAKQSVTSSASSPSAGSLQAIIGAI